MQQTGKEDIARAGVEGDFTEAFQNGLKRTTSTSSSVNTLCETTN